MRDVSDSLPTLFHHYPLQKKLTEKIQERYPLRAIFASLTENISSNEPIGDQLQHGPKC